VADVAEFGQRDVFQPFTAFIEAFVDFNGSFLHKRMSIFTSAPKEEIISASLPWFARLYCRRPILVRRPIYEFGVKLSRRVSLEAG